MLDKRVAITPINDPDISPGGIIIPDEAKERSDQGYVKYLGTNCEELEVGDYVMFSGYTGTNLAVDGEGHVIIMHKDFIICKLDPPNTQVPGLYYRDKKGWKEYVNKIVEYLYSITNDLFIIDEPVHREFIEKLLAEHQPYFNADSETSLYLIAQAMRNHPFHRSTGIVDYRSKKDKSGF